MPDLGKKHECVSCGARFYDLGRSKLICPKCATDQHDEPDPANVGAGAKAKRKPKKKPAKKAKKAKKAAKKT